MRKKLSIESLINKSRNSNASSESSINVLEERRKIIEEFKNKQLSPQPEAPVEATASLREASAVQPSNDMDQEKKTEPNRSYDVEKVGTQSGHKENTRTLEYEHKADTWHQPIRNNTATKNNEYEHNLNEKNSSNEYKTAESINHITNTNTIYKKYEHNRDTDYSKYEHRGNTEAQESAHKTDTKTGPLSHQVSQIDGKENSNYEFKVTRRADSANTEKTQSGHRVDTGLDTTQTQSGHKPNSIRTQGEHRADTGLDTSTDTSLVKKSYVNYVYNLPVNENKVLQTLVSLAVQSSSLSSPAMTYKSLAKLSDVSDKSIKTTVSRLKKKGFVVTESYFKGPGSTIILSITNDVYSTYLQYSAKNIFNVGSIYEHKKNTGLNTDLDTNPPSKLVSNLNNTNNTTKRLIYDFNVTDDLVTDDLRMLGIGKKHVGDALRNLTKKLESNAEIIPVSKEDFQDFIKMFVEYANSEHGKKMKNKAGVFISEFDRFQTEGSCSTTEWYNDKETDNYEAFVKQVEAELKRKKEFIEKALEYKFMAWMEKMSKEQLLEIVPEGQFTKFGGPGHEMALKNYFRTNVWETVKKEIESFKE